MPYEVELCEALGITDKEYFEFLDLAETYTARKKEYDHIPEIAAGPAALPFLYTGGALNFWGHLAVALVLNTVAYLLTPKPKQPKQPPSLEIGGVQGRSRFNPTHGFDSLQDLASLGSFIPLVYARKGVRVSSQLLWSQVRTTQYGESINAIALFSNGEIGAKPQFESLALGETFLSQLPESKLKVYFSRGARVDGRLKGVPDTEVPSNSADQYQKGSAQNSHTYSNRGNKEYDDSDPFLVKVYEGGAFVYKPSFCSTRTPTTNNIFGVYSPMPNGNAYKVRWELLLQPKGQDDSVGQDTRHKMGKVMNKYPRYIGIVKNSNSPTYSFAGDGVVLNPNQVLPDSLIVDYHIHHEVEESAWIDLSRTTTTNDNSKKWNKFSPWGSGDAKSVVDTGRENVDDAMALGEQYMVGSSLMTVTGENNENKWIAGYLGSEKKITLKVDESGYVEFRNTEDTKMPFESLVVQKVSLATFANTRKTDVTEIGIKSTVWRKISGFPNVNEMPSEARIRSYEEASGSIQLGSIDKYVKRLSFFVVQARKINSGNKFVDIDSTPICIKGSSPIAQYNAISIRHINGSSQYEFRLKPIPGNVVLNYYDNRSVNVLSYAESIKHFTNDTLGLTISYHAKREQLPTESQKSTGNPFTNNIEWDRGNLGQKFDVTNNNEPVASTGPVAQFTQDTLGEMPDADATWTDLSTPFQPDFRATYYGNGPDIGEGSGNPRDPRCVLPLDPATKVTPCFVELPDGTKVYDHLYINQTNYNLKGTPVSGNAFFSPEKGVYVMSEDLPDGTRMWTYSVGGTLINSQTDPTKRVTGNLSNEPQKIKIKHKSNYKPYTDNDWTDPIEEIDKNTGVGTGIYHRFRLARTPSSWGGAEDWRGSARHKDTNNLTTQTPIAGVHLYAIAIQRRSSIPEMNRTYERFIQSQGGLTTSGSGTGLMIAVDTYTGTGSQQGKIAKEFTVLQPGDGFADGDTVTLSDTLYGNPIELTVTIVPPTVDVPEVSTHSDWSKDGTADYYRNYWQHMKHNPNNAIADYFLFDAESSSHESKAEHEISYINEIVHAGTAAAPQINYESLAIGGIRVGASNTLSSFNSFSGFIEKGIKVDRLIPDVDYTLGTSYLTRNSEIASTDNFVEIAYDLLTNKSYGAGDLIGHDGVDRAMMIEAARYCKANNFYWNGIIDRKFNLREFIFENAAYNFLDFSIMGGRFSLRPSFPIKDNYEIDYDATIGNKGIKIKALFTDGNMKDIKVTFLTPEERKMFKATVIYRDDKVNNQGIAGFSENIAKTYAYNPSAVNSTFTNQEREEFYKLAEQLPEEVFDLSNWCTSELHAKKFAAIALTTRKEVDHGIVFQTPPSSVFGLLAGDYIRVLTEATHTSRFNNGSIDKDGIVISRATISGNINSYVWTPGSLGGIEEKTFSVGSDGKNSLGLTNKLFAQVDTTEEDRIYKVESITYGEEGFIEIAASHVPLTSDDKLAVLYHANPSDVSTNIDFNIRFPELR